MMVEKVQSIDIVRLLCNLGIMLEFTIIHTFVKISMLSIL